MESAPATVRFTLERLSEILTMYAQSRSEINSRQSIIVHKLMYDREEDEYITDCEVFTATEH